MSTNDRYKVIDHQLLDEEEISNVYWYQQIEGEGDAEHLAETFVSELLGYIRAVQSSALTHTSIEVINYDSLADFFQLDLSSGNAGLRSGEHLPRWNAWGFKLHRPTRAIRSGAKRIAGVTEADTTNGDANATFVSTLDDLATAMGGLLVSAVSTRYQPQIVTINPLTGEIVNDIGINEASYVRITTQNSRKR